MDPMEQYALQKTLETGYLRPSSNLASTADPRLPQELKDRLPAAQAHAEAQMQRVSAVILKRKHSHEANLTALLRSRRSAEHRYGELVKVADEVASAIAPRAACKRGCAHCCHIPVAMSSAEARVMGHALGVVPQEPSGALLPSQRSYGYDHPCPFLEQGQCSIYEHRPFACRVHFSMDVDSTLCQLLPEVPVPVPLADVRVLQSVYIQWSEGSELGDVRDFFPTGKRKRTPGQG